MSQAYLIDQRLKVMGLNLRSKTKKTHFVTSKISHQDA